MTRVQPASRSTKRLNSQALPAFRRQVVARRRPHCNYHCNPSWCARCSCALGSAAALTGLWAMRMLHAAGAVILRQLVVALLLQYARILLHGSLRRKAGADLLMCVCLC